MSLETSDFSRLVLEEIPIVDVRAPVEFEVGYLPHSVNIPILENPEREAVGTTYKKKGREAALALGHELVAGATKEARIGRWAEALSRHPESVITCWRGGLRSQLAQQWSAERGVERARLRGGYKAFRNFLLQSLSEVLSRRPVLVVGGVTGSGKSRLLGDLESIVPVLDLERAARHRGSAFGALDGGQPAQASFENLIASILLRLDRQWPEDLPLVVEDESRMIGSLVLPEVLFDKLRVSPVVLIEEPLAERVEAILQDYVIESGLVGGDPEREALILGRYRKSLQAISRKLGGLRYQECSALLEDAFRAKDREERLSLHRRWIGRLLEWYYDPLYRKSLERRQPSFLVRGNREEIFNFLKGKNKIKTEAAISRKAMPAKEPMPSPKIQ